jgi:hypothetical protein
LYPLTGPGGVTVPVAAWVGASACLGAGEGTFGEATVDVLAGGTKRFCSGARGEKGGIV